MIPTPGQAQNYLLVLDDTIDLAHPSRRSGAFGGPDEIVANIVHSVLFDGPGFLSDSHAINNYNFRCALQSGPALLRELVRRHYLQVAQRVAAGQRVDLPSLRDNFKKSGKQHRYFADDVYDASEDLMFLQNHARVIPFSMESASVSYPLASIRIFAEGQLENRLPKHISEAIALAATERYRGSGSLGQAFYFHDDQLGQLLEARFPGQNIWPQYRDLIRTAAAAPYATFLADEFKAHPVFARKHKEAIDLWLKRLASTSELMDDPVILPRRIDPAAFDRGLLALSIDDIDRLKDSDEWRGYVAARAKVSEKTESVRAVIAAYAAYRDLVISRIVERLRPSKNQIDPGPEVQARLFKAAKNGAWYIGMQYLDLKTAGLASIAEWLTSLYHDTAGTDDESQATQQGRTMERTAQEVRNHEVATLLAELEVERQAGRAGLVEAETKIRSQSEWDTEMPNASVN